MWSLHSKHHTTHPKPAYPRTIHTCASRRACPACGRPTGAQLAPRPCTRPPSNLQHWHSSRHLASKESRLQSRRPPLVERFARGGGVEVRKDRGREVRPRFGGVCPRFRGVCPRFGQGSETCVGQVPEASLYLFMLFIVARIQKCLISTDECGRQSRLRV